MNRFLVSALALCTASSLASGGTPSPESEDWLSLDREIESLAASLSQGSNGFEVSGFLRVFLEYSNDIEDVNGSGNDLTGFSLMNGRVMFDGAIEDYSIHIGLEGTEVDETDSTNGSSLQGNVEGGVITPGTNGADVYLGEIGMAGSVSLIDAYMSTPLNEDISFMMGQFRTPFLNSGLVEADRLVLPYRSFNGAVWDARDLGVQFSGIHDRFQWWAAAQNGIDGAGDELHYTVRGAVDLLGEGGMPTQEGSHGKSQAEHLFVAAAYTMDDENPGTNDDREAIGIEAGYNQGNFSVGGEWVDYDDGFTNNGDSLNPWAIMGSFLFNPEWEVAARAEWVEDDDDTEIYSLGVNYYVSGHAAKWQLAWSKVDSDINSLDYDIVSLGFTGGIGR